MVLAKSLLILLIAGKSLQTSLLTLKPEADTSKIKPCKGANLLSCVVAEVDVAAFDDDSLSLPGCENLKEKNLIEEASSRSGAADVAKSVAYENEEGCEVVVSIRGKKVMANVDLPDGRDFALEPCSAFKGCHVWMEEDKEKFVDGDSAPLPPDTRNIFSSRAREEFREQGILDDTTIATFSVKYYYTKEFAAATDDIELYMDQVTAETNQGYINSLIPVRMKIHCIEAADLNDIADGSEMLNTFRAYKGTVEALRGGADAAALLVNNFNYCGIGYLDSWRSGWTITAQQKSCALGYYTMGHELGHNFGCTHDREHSSSGRYDYGFGAYIGSGPYRTNMAYSKTGYNRKGNIYSSPVAQWQGIITGTETENNARVIKENRFAMAAVGDESGTCDWQFSSTTEAPTAAPTTAATVAPTTEVFTFPTTFAPTTEVFTFPTSDFPTTFAPTTEVFTFPTSDFPTTLAPTTEVPTFPTTEFPTTFFPTSDFPTTFAPTTEVPTFPTSDFPTTFFPTSDFPTTDFPTTTSGPAVGGQCREKGVVYLGTRMQVKRRRARNPRICENRCKSKSECDNWTWYPNLRSIPREMRKNCILRSDLESEEKSNIDGVISGRPSQC